MRFLPCFFNLLLVLISLEKGSVLAVSTIGSDILLFSVSTLKVCNVILIFMDVNTVVSAHSYNAIMITILSKMNYENIQRSM